MLSVSCGDVGYDHSKFFSELYSVTLLLRKAFIYLYSCLFFMDAHLPSPFIDGSFRDQSLLVARIYHFQHGLL